MSRRPEILPLVIADLTDRVERQGMETYGKPMQANDGRDSLVDLYEELLDACCYLRKLLAERERFSGPVSGLDHVDGVAGAVRHIEGWAD